MLAMRAWDCVHPGFVDWRGALLLAGAGVQEQSAYSFEQIEAAAAAQLEPKLSKEFLEANKHQLFHFPQEGQVDPDGAVAMIAARAAALGVQFVFGVDVRALQIGSGGSVTGVEGSFENGDVFTISADIVVLANGTGVEELARTAGFEVPMVCKPGYLSQIQPARDLKLSKIVVSANLHFLQRDDGKLIVGESKEAGGASSVAFAVQQDAPNAKGDGANANGNGTSSLSEEKEREGREKRAREVRAERERETAERERRERREMGERMLQQAQALVPDLDDASVTEVTLGFRPMPADGFPVIGFLQRKRGGRRRDEREGAASGAYVCVMHSGVTLGPLAGAMAALEICTGQDAAILKPFRPSRFASSKPPSDSTGINALSDELLALCLSHVTPAPQMLSACGPVSCRWRTAAEEAMLLSCEWDLSSTSVDGTVLGQWLEAKEEALMGGREVGKGGRWEGGSGGLGMGGKEQKGERSVEALFKVDLQRLDLSGCSSLSSPDLGRALEKCPTVVGRLEGLAISRMKGGGGRLPPGIGDMHRLSTLVAESCHLTGSLDRALLQLTSLSELNLGDNSLLDINAPPVLVGLASLAVVDLRGNMDLWSGRGFAMGNDRRITRNQHVLNKLQKKGAVVLVDGDIRPPICVCCR